MAFILSHEDRMKNICTRKFFRRHATLSLSSGQADKQKSDSYAVLVQAHATVGHSAASPY